MVEKFIQKLAEEINRELPGFSAQKGMAPLGRKPLTDYLKTNVAPKKSAVLILLYPNSDLSSLKTVLILRAENEGGNHGGQISFPGGGVHLLDKSLSETALREAEEEIGIDKNAVVMLGELTPLYIPVSNYMVYPFVGTSNTTPEFKIHPPEVQELVEIEINDLLSEKNIKSVKRFIKLRNSEMQVPCYEINGKTIWGATAMIISEFLAIMKKIENQ